MLNKSRNRPKNAFKALSRILSYFKGWKGFILFIVICLTIFSSIVSIVGTYFLQDVISTISGLVNGTSTWTDLISIISIIAGLYVLGALSTLVYNQLMIRTSQKIIGSIRTELEEHMLKMSLSDFDKKQHGEIMTYFTNDIDTLNNALNDSFANIFHSLANIVGTLIGMFLINVYLSLIVCVFLIAMIVFISLNSKLSRKYFKAQQKELSNMNGLVEETINGIKVEKAFNHEEQGYEKFVKQNEALQKAATDSFFHTQLNVPVIVALSYFNFAISCIVGIIFTYNGMLAGGIAALTSYLVYVRQAGQPFNMFTSHINSILTAFAGAERIFDYLDQDEELDEGKVELVKVSNDGTDFKDHYVWKYINENGEVVQIPLRGSIIFNHVTFGYNKEKVVLYDVSFWAEPGQKIAFVGSTGAGKTTIISLISRLYEINEGEITYDGINIKDIKKESLRRSISMVTQDTHLFTGTIRENIKYVRQHSTDEEMYQAAKNANADSFIKLLPEQYDTNLIDDGHNLSEGQRQLLALARAAISKPPILILDEATSNIDTHTEQLIQKSMNTLMEDRTVLVIAHRLSTVRNSEAIICLEHGRVIERGTHEQLLALKGHYYKLYNGIIEIE